MKALLDINILLDVLLARQPWAADAVAVCQACSEGKMEGYVTAVTLPTLFYIVRRNAGLTKAKDAVDMCLESFDVLSVDRPCLELARTLTGSDFEDNVQIAAALSGGMDWIVTRDQGLLHPNLRTLDSAGTLALLSIT